MSVMGEAFAKAPIAMAIFDRAGRCVAVNDAARACFGAEPPGADGAAAGFEIVVTRLDDVHDLLTYRDVAERDRWRALEVRLRDAFYEARMLTWDIYPETGEVSFFGDPQQVLGLPRDQPFDRKQGFAMIHPDDRERALAVFARETELPVQIALRIIRPDDGRVMWLERRGHWVPPRDGRPGYHRGVTFDVDARMIVEERLRASERRFRALVGNGRDVVSLHDRTGAVIWTSPSIEHVLGYTPEERLGRNPSEWTHPDDLPMRREQLRNIATTHDPIHFEFRTRDKRGTYRWMEGTAINLLDDPDVGAIAFFQSDITERKQAEILRTRALELELENRRMSEATRMKSAFLAEMSHELRTPLNAIVGFAELLHDGRVDPADPMHREFVADILTSGRHLLRLVNDILDLAKVEAGKLELAPQVIELAAHIDEVVAMLRTTAIDRSITVTLDLEPALVTVELDPSRLRQILYNYLSNALKFTGLGGHVVVRTRIASETHFRIEVADDGIGISAAEQSHLFTTFHQLEAGRKTLAGSGLGLALTKRLVEAQGGSVGVRSTPGEGSVFFALLPRRAAP